MSTIYSFWISGPLQPINLLTIRSFKAMGHRLIIYSYDLTITTECEVRDARLIMPESELVIYTHMLGGNPRFKFGAAAERLKAEMLYHLGDWHVDLDVTCLIPFTYPMAPGGKSLNEMPYVLRPHAKGVVANIIKAPRQSELARLYIEHTKTIKADNRIWEASFNGLNQIVNRLRLENNIAPKEILGDDTDPYWRWFITYADVVPTPQLHAIHWCNAMGLTPHYKSFLASLYKKYNIEI